ncbi:hypothetical protein VIGAN_02034800 [Vigna angularis var. angularis]|uniref:Uncharacterized protein n=1 Tax=Vigna angularis var. angularis TaxID=157739 RepID=A0A0S3RAX2_PHAAN|nr:hypothetical protein VIGAN_02034800 [Vigna angularis var. angularis]
MLSPHYLAFSGTLQDCLPIPPQKVSLYSASQGLQQQPWHFSQQLLHQVIRHPYQQKPRPQQYNHVKQHYDLFSKNINSH